MSTPTFPTLRRIAPASLQWGLQANTIVFESPLNKTIQTLESPGARWYASFAMESLDADDASILAAFLAALRGRAGRFLIHNMAHPRPRGTIAGTPLVNGAGQTGAALNIDGVTVGTTLLRGDYIGVGTELKMVVADATANGSGEMTLAIEPPWRTSPADGAAVVTEKPTCTMMLNDDSMSWVTTLGVRTNITLDMIEAFV